MSTRALNKGFLLAVRTKKTIIFVALFIFLVVLSIASVNQIHLYETDKLLNIRGVSVSFEMPLTEDSFFGSWGKLLAQVGQYSRGIYIVYGTRISLGGTTIGFVWLEPYSRYEVSSELPWVVEETKPTKIVDGRALDFGSSQEGIVGKTFNISFTLAGNVNISVSSSVGSKIIINTQKGVETLKIVGVSSDSFSKFASPLGVSKSAIIFATKSFIDELEGKISPLTKYVLRVIFTAKGSLDPITALFGGSAIDKNRDAIENALNDAGYTPDTLTKISEKQLQSAIAMSSISFLLTLLIGLGYASLLVGARRFDIATLRAIGWGSKHIFALVLGEFMLTIFVGTFLGMLFGAIIFLFYGIPTSLWPFIIAFITALIVLFVGLFIIRKRVLSIPPAEAFRAR